MPKKSQEPIAMLRELLSEQPSEEEFAKVMDFFRNEPWEDREAEAFALEYAENHLQAWDNDLRKFGAYRLWKDCPKGEPEACFRLIRYLDLGSNSEGVYRFGPEGAKELAQSPHLARLTRLYFWGNGLQDEGLSALAESPYLGHVRALTVLGNQITDQGAIALAQSTQLAQLQYVALSYNSIEDAGAIALANPPHLKHLHDVYINDNQVGEKGALALAFSKQMSEKTRRYWLTQLSPETLAIQAQKAGISGHDQMDTAALIEAILLCLDGFYLA